MHFHVASRLFAASAVLLAPFAAVAAPITFTGSSGGLSASAAFSVVGSNLQIVLTNTSSSDATLPADILTGIFFNVAGSPALAAASAISGGTTYSLNPPGAPTIVSGAGTDIGGAWAYA